MKYKLFALGALVILSAANASAQSIDDLFKKENLPGLIFQTAGGIVRTQQGKQEQIKVGRENLKINESQPSIDLRGQRILIRVKSNAFEYGSRDDDIETLMQARQVLTSQGATVGFDADQLDELTEYFDKVNDNKYVDPKTKFGLGTLAAPTLVAEVTTTMIDSSSELEGFWGKFFRSFDFELERSTAYGGITIGFQPLVGEHAGNFIATYRVIGRSSTTDHLEVSLWNSLFNGGVSNDTNEEEKRWANAAGDAFKQLRGLLNEKRKAFGS